MRCYVTHGLTERVAEHRDQRGAVDDGGALKRGGDDGGRCEAQGDCNCGGQSALSVGEHAGELSGFHDVFPFVSLIALLRWNVM